MGERQLSAKTAFVIGMLVRRRRTTVASAFQRWRSALDTRDTLMMRRHLEALLARVQDLEQSLGDASSDDDEPWRRPKTTTKRFSVAPQPDWPPLRIARIKDDVVTTKKTPRRRKHPAVYVARVPLAI